MESLCCNASTECSLFCCQTLNFSNIRQNLCRHSSLSFFVFFQAAGGLAQALLCRLGREYIRLPTQLLRKLLWRHWEWHAPCPILIQQVSNNLTIPISSITYSVTSRLYFVFLFESLFSEVSHAKKKMFWPILMLSVCVRQGKSCCRSDKVTVGSKSFLTTRSERKKGRHS